MSKREREDEPPPRDGGSGAGPAPKRQSIGAAAAPTPEEPDGDVPSPYYPDEDEDEDAGEYIANPSEDLKPYMTLRTDNPDRKACDFKPFEDAFASEGFSSRSPAVPKSFVTACVRALPEMPVVNAPEGTWAPGFRRDDDQAESKEAEERFASALKHTARLLEHILRVRDAVAPVLGHSWSSSELSIYVGITGVAVNTSEEDGPGPDDPASWNVGSGCSGGVLDRMKAYLKQDKKKAGGGDASSSRHYMVIVASYGERRQASVAEALLHARMAVLGVPFNNAQAGGAPLSEHTAKVVDSTTTFRYVVYVRFHAPSLDADTGAKIAAWIDDADFR